MLAVCKPWQGVSEGNRDRRQLPMGILAQGCHYGSLGHLGKHRTIRLWTQGVSLGHRWRCWDSEHVGGLGT